MPFDLTHVQALLIGLTCVALAVTLTPWGW